MEEDVPVRVSDAVALFFPHGGLKTVTLMNAIRSGRLGHTRLGRSYFVTRAAGIYDGRRDDVRDFCLKYIRNPSAVPWLEATTTRFERFNGECGKDAKFYEPLPSPVPGAGG